MNIIAAHSGWWVIVHNVNEEPFSAGRVIGWQGDDSGYSPLLETGLFDTASTTGRNVSIGHEDDRPVKQLLVRIAERDKHNFRVTNPGA